MKPSPQLGFDDLLADAATTNRERQRARATAHLPGSFEAGVPFFRDLIDRHHAAMLAADVETTHALRRDARDLALKLNGGSNGILANANAAGSVLVRDTAAAPGAVPLWGQCGTFVITHHDMRVRVSMNGIFEIGADWDFWLGFEVHAVDWDRPFLSKTGYRSFLGPRHEVVPDLTVDAFTRRVIDEHITRDLKGRLEPIARNDRR